MQFFKDEKEVQDVCDAMEVDIMDETYNEAIGRIKVLEMNVKSEARRELEVPKTEDGLLLKDTCETIMTIIDFEKSDVIKIYKNLTSYVLGHNESFINFHPVLRRICMLVKSMQRLYNKYIAESVHAWNQNQSRLILGWFF